jgi:hypothetical protein
MRFGEYHFSDHHKDSLSCSPHSPYAKLMAYGGEIMEFGLPPADTKFLHVVDDMDLADYPRRLILIRSTILW